MCKITCITKNGNNVHNNTYHKLEINVFVIGATDKRENKIPNLRLNLLRFL